MLKQACSADQAVVGVGTPTTDATIVQLGYLTAADVQGLREQGVVGDILGQFFDADGKVADVPIHDRRIGIDLSDLKYIPKVVGVALAACTRFRRSWVRCTADSSTSW